jgi:protease I
MRSESNSKRVAILVTNGFEQVEMTEPREALKKAGFQTDLVSPAQGEVQGWDHDDKADKFRVDVELNSADPAEYHALLLPGGVRNPDELRMIPEAVKFVKSFLEDSKPVAAICHGPWMLVEADAVRGKRVTSWPSLKTDLRNAGGNWSDQEVIADGNIVTSRKSDDIPAFNSKMIELFSSAGAQRQPVGAGRESRL